MNPPEGEMLLQALRVEWINGTVKMLEEPPKQPDAVFLLSKWHAQFHRKESYSSASLTTDKLIKIQTLPLSSLKLRQL